MADLLRIGSKEEANDSEDQQQEAKYKGEPHSTVRDRRRGKGRRGVGRGREGKRGKKEEEKDGEEVKIGKREGKEEDKGRELGEGTGRKREGSKLFSI